MKLFTNSKTIIEALEKLGITTSEGVLNYLPYRYEDMSYSDEDHICDKEKVTLIGKLVSNPKHFNNGKLDIITFFFVTRNKHFFNVKMFNRGFYLSKLTLGEEYSITGIYNLEKKEISLTNIIQGEIEKSKALRSIYHLPQSISKGVYANFVGRTYENMQEYIIDELPSYFKKKYHLLDKREALKYVHLPESLEQVSLGLRTLKYHECLAFSLKNQIIRHQNKSKPSIAKEKIDTSKINQFILNLPFKLTHDQITAIREIIIDMNNDELMYRLLQGDVGSGKTIVAAIALYGNYLRKRIGAFMVPTDSLARQQYKYLNDLFSQYNIHVGLLIGSLTNKNKNIIKEQLKNGEIDIVVGTQALFSNDVEYPNLGLALIDEQHRFGVNQRNELLSKDDICDLLLMSATPIPRTLAISIYGDLDVSSLNEFPNQKREVITEIVSSKSYRIIETIKDALSENRQVFIVTPKIENKDESLTSVEKIYEIYHILFKDEVALLHGKMKSEEKNQILDDFISGKKKILVSTTVIELGINVLNAKAIIIYNASFFGLASLHQLRGRVGRDGQEAICLLVDDNENNERLKVLVESNDGFYIAEQDMKMRGPGDMIGIKQSGFPTFSSLNIVDDFRMFECARNDASFIINNLNDEELKKYYNIIEQEINSKENITLFD